MVQLDQRSPVPGATMTNDEALEPHLIEIVRADREAHLPAWASKEALARFFHEKMRPYHDQLDDVRRALGDAFSGEPGRGGFVLYMGWGGRLVGALTMLRTGMKGYIPENLLLFVAVDPEWRNLGVGRRLIERLLVECEGAVKLHVEPDNPARRLYERCGFLPKYVEMRCQR